MTNRLKRTELHGGGLRLRPWDVGIDGDPAAYLRGVSDPEFQRWNNPLHHVDDLESARRALRDRAALWDAGTAAAFCVTDAADGTVLGNLSLNSPYWPNRSATVGYWVLPEARGRGVAARGLALVADWAFGLGLHRLALDHSVGNTASCRVAERCGFPYEGTLREAHRNADGTFQDAHLHARLASDGSASSSAGPGAATHRRELTAEELVARARRLPPADSGEMRGEADAFFGTEGRLGHDGDR
ncbi:GNAT family N-acetyltransferase [Streptomyces sp. Da 82-17]|uniref:GNAT family N-acetyltransferase n=1 Tax=Streptomyces sp. Da 82-17 TaxID=3377116 RepID=UPI0038D44255